MRAPSVWAPNGRRTMNLGHRFSFQPVEVNRLDEANQDDDRCSAMKRRRDVRQPAPGSVPAATPVDGPQALARLIALAATLTRLAGGVLADDPVGGLRQQEAKRPPPPGATCKDTAQHPKEPELCEETVEMPVANRSNRAGCTIRPKDRALRTITP